MSVVIVIAMVLCALAAMAAPIGDLQPPLPGPAPRPVGGQTLEQRLSANTGCVGCHPDEAREWQASLHRHAWVDPVFQKALAVEPLPFCQSCHAPESDPAVEPSARAATTGIGCVTCHVENEHVFGTRQVAGSAAGHPVFADARLATKAACASCHQFDFPSHANQIVPEPMQDTVREHAASSAKDTPCQSCHMPEVRTPDGTHRSHAFSVIGDPAILRSAVSASAERVSPTAVRLTLAPGKIGHAFPTGDMFRRLEVRAEALDHKGSVVASAPPAILARVFADVPRDPLAPDDLTFMRVTASDTRLPPPGVEPSRQVELVLPREVPGTRLRWRVVYQRMSTPMAEAFGVSQVLDEIIVAEGTLLSPKRKGRP